MFQYIYQQLSMFCDLNKYVKCTYNLHKIKSPKHSIHIVAPLFLFIVKESGSSISLLKARCLDGCGRLWTIAVGRNSSFEQIPSSRR